MRKAPRDLRLKIAVIESRKTQRRIALDTRLGETRLSEIVGHRGAPATAAEKQRLAKYLGRQVADLFPIDDGETDAEQAPREQFGTPGRDQR